MWLWCWLFGHRWEHPIDRPSGAPLLRMRWCPRCLALEVDPRVLVTRQWLDEQAASLEHLAVELEKWIELAHEVVDPPEPCAYDDLRDALRAKIAPNEVVTP